jgi:hypothetical protein
MSTRGTEKEDLESLQKNQKKIGKAASDRDDFRSEELLETNRFLNPIRLWQNYLIDWIETSREYYEYAIKANEQWLKVSWNVWLTPTGIKRKETIKIE